KTNQKVKTVLRKFLKQVFKTAAKSGVSCFVFAEQRRTSTGFTAISAKLSVGLKHFFRHHENCL
ncbi:hypothetical protein, partial [Mesonia hippocampi]|uniref:hypothetical protein n=1 Tax=Mesonia hippocampi TaxID=1628250 RepID=UPI003F98AE37